MSNFLFGFVKTGEMFGDVGYVNEQNGLAGCRLNMFCFDTSFRTVIN